MAYIVVTGKDNCPNTTHALHVCEHLSKNLPHFSYRQLIQTESDWPLWLNQLNNVNDWHQTTSPVIWKEISRIGGKPFLVGGLGEFWEYCYDYYGFQSRMSKETLNRIMQDNALILSHEIEQKINTISIIGAADYEMLQLHIYELQNCLNLKKNGQLEIKLFDDRLDDPDEVDHMLLCLETLRDSINFIPQSIYLVTSLEDAIKNCDLMLIIQDYTRRPSEDADSWLERCKNEMVYLAGDINSFAKRSLRIILNHHGPICFNASVLMEYCTVIKLSNIVAITADEGIATISMMADKIRELVENFWCPPVWGFSGIMSYVNVKTTPIRGEVYRPYKRSLKIKESSQLPKGEMIHEIRYLGCLLPLHEKLSREIEERKAKESNLLQRKPNLAKIRALASLLKLWYAEEIGDDIISLGVCSNGDFDIPPGICFSQPVSLNEKRVWQPLTYLPLYKSTALKIQEILVHVENTFKKFGLGNKFHGEYKNSIRIYGATMPETTSN